MGRGGVAAHIGVWEAAGAARGLGLGGGLMPAEWPGDEGRRSPKVDEGMVDMEEHGAHLPLRVLRPAES